MYHALVILVHRPFVSEGHLQSIVGFSTTAAFKLCGDAAYGTDAVLRTYGQHFDFSGCPYFLSYATYASGTIHARIAAQSPTGLRAHLALWNCLDVLEQQQAVCHAPRASMKILMALVKRLGVDTGRQYRVKNSRSEALGGEGTPSELSERYVVPMVSGDDEFTVNLDFDPTQLDIDAVIQSFSAASQETNTLSVPQIAAPVDSEPNTTSMSVSGKTNDMFDSWDLSGYDQLDDPVFGIDSLLSENAWSN